MRRHIRIDLSQDQIDSLVTGALRQAYADREIPPKWYTKKQKREVEKDHKALKRVHNYFSVPDDWIE